MTMRKHKGKKRTGLAVKLHEVPDKPKDSKRALAVDLGTQLGYAICDYADDKDNRSTDFNELAGCLKLVPGARESWGARVTRFKAFLTRVKPDIVFYENVKQRFKSNAAAVCYGALLSVVIDWCETNDVDYVAFDVGTIKKYATGKGNAGKDKMIIAANKRFDMEFDPAKDKLYGDVADALHILSMGMDQMFACRIYNDGERDDGIGETAESA